MHIDILCGVRRSIDAHDGEHERYTKFDHFLHLLVSTVLEARVFVGERR